MKLSWGIVITHYSVLGKNVSSLRFGIAQFKWGLVKESCSVRRIFGKMGGWEGGELLKNLRL